VVDTKAAREAVISENSRAEFSPYCQPKKKDTRGKPGPLS
jgi:hypothetical protein